MRDGFSIPFYVAFYTCCLAERFTIILVTRPENFEKARKTRAVPVATLQEAMAMAEKLSAGKIIPLILFRTAWQLFRFLISVCNFLI